MTRNAATDHLLSPANAALVMIDYQPGLIDGTHSISHANLVNNAVAMAKSAQLFDLPVVLSTIAVNAGYQEPTIGPIRDALPGVQPIDRSAVNAWEDEAFRDAIRATGRRKLLMAGLWTEVCLAFPALDLLREGYEVYALSDVSGGTTVDAHDRAMQRLVQAGAVPVTWEAVLAELGRFQGYDFAAFLDVMTQHLPASRPGPLRA